MKNRLAEVYRKIKLFIYRTGLKVERCASYANKKGIGKIMDYMHILFTLSCSGLRCFAVFTAGIFKKTYRYMIQAGAVLIVLGVIAASQMFAIAVKVEVNDRVVGYVHNQSEYEDAIAKVENDISKKVGEDYYYGNIPSFSYSVVKKSDVVSEKEVYNEVYAEAKEDIGQSFGLFIEGEFIGACRKEAELLDMLDGIKKDYSTGTPGETVEFIKNVKIEKNMYARNDVYTAEELKNKFATPSTDSVYVVEKGDTPGEIAAKFDISLTTLASLNSDANLNKVFIGQKLYVAKPKLDIGVRVVRTITYTEAIKYDTKKSYTNDLYEGATKVSVKGQNGQNKITATVTYVDGAETNRVILERANVSQPVTEQILVGTKTIAPSGSFIWPVPSSRRISSPFGYRGREFHPAIDIAAPKGSAIRAADGGTVITAGWLRTGAGYAVEISHGNGVITKYYHCSALYVNVGQKVAQGQTIAAVGATGRASGSHCHFELTNTSGASVNPVSYLK